MDTGSFIIYERTEGIFKDISEDVETIFLILQAMNQTDHYHKEKKAIGLMKDELGRKIMKDFVGLKAKTYSSLIDDNSADKKSKGTKKCVIKRKLRFEHYENCLDATQLENEIKHLEKKKQN